MKIKLLFLLSKIILIFILIDYTKNKECLDRNNPILFTSTNECVLRYCTEKEFESNICIKNKYLEVQWLNKIIKFGDKNSRFTKIAKYDNEDIIFFSAVPSGNTSPFFYGLKENGRPFFNEDGKETPYYSLEKTLTNIEDPTLLEYDDGEILIIKMGDNNEEYMLNVGKKDKFTELYDFKNKKVYLKQTKYAFEIPDYNPIFNHKRGALFNLKDSKYFFFGGISLVWDYSSRSYLGKLYLNKLYLDKKENLESLSNSLIYTSSERKYTAYGNMVSCIQIEKIIVCFYIYSLYEQTYQIIVFDENLIEKKTFNFQVNFIDENIFFKCIHYEIDQGIFVFYNKVYGGGPFPLITIKSIGPTKIENVKWLSSFLLLDSYYFNTNLNLNDIVKLNNENICFTSVSDEKEILYIVMINIFENLGKKNKG